MRNVKITILISLALINLFGCFNSNSFEEITRKSSPDGKVDAVVLKINTHSTTPYSYRLYIVPKDKKVQNIENELFLANRVDELLINWEANKLLEINYKNARIFHFSNFWHSKEVDNFKYIVELKLHPKKNLVSLKK